MTRDTLQHLAGMIDRREGELANLKRRRDEVIRSARSFHTERELAEWAGLSAPRVHQIVRAFRASK